MVEQVRTNVMESTSHVTRGQESDPAKFPERPQFIFHYRDAFFDRSVAFARKLDAAHECATSANFHFR